MMSAPVQLVITVTPLAKFTDAVVDAVAAIVSEPQVPEVEMLLFTATAAFAGITTSPLAKAVCRSVVLIVVAELSVLAIQMPSSKYPPEVAAVEIVTFPEITGVVIAWVMPWYPGAAKLIDVVDDVAVSPLNVATPALFVTAVTRPPTPVPEAVTVTPETAVAEPSPARTLTFG